VINLGPGDRLFDEGKVIAKQFLGLRADDVRSSAIDRSHGNLCGDEGAGVVAAYSVMVIGPAPIDRYLLLDLARELSAAGVLLSPFWAGAAHVVRLGSIGVE
jgi:hypothetical protein